MQEEHIFYILKIVKQKKKVNLLLHEGLSYKKIGELTELALNKNLIEIIEGDFSLTKLGEKQYELLEKMFKKVNKNEWIDDVNGNNFLFKIKEPGQFKNFSFI